MAENTEPLTEGQTCATSVSGLELHTNGERLPVDDGIVVDSELSESSKNPVQNKVITAALKGRVQQVDELPDTGEYGILYLVPSGDEFEEYLWVTKSDQTEGWELVGTAGEIEIGIPTDATFWGASYDSTNNKVDGDIKLTGYTIGINNGVLWFGTTSSGYIGRSFGVNAAGTPYFMKSPSFNNNRLQDVKDPAGAQDAATKNYVDIRVLTNAGAPTTSTVGVVGQLLEDTTNGKLYQCTDATNPYVWTEVGGGIPTNATFWGRSYDNVNNKVSGSIKLANNERIVFNNQTSNAIYTDSNGQLTLSNPQAINISTNGNARIRIDSNGFQPWGDIRMDYSGSRKKIVQLGDPTNAYDAANKNYVDSIYPVGAVFTSTSATAPTIAGGTWTQIGTQTIGSSTVHYYERTA